MFRLKARPGLRVTLTISAAALVLTACGGGAGETAKDANLSAKSADELYSAAKEEGRVEVATPIEGEALNELADAFQSKYPGIEVEWARVTGESDMQRMVTEWSSGKVSVDTVSIEAEAKQQARDLKVLDTSIDWAKYGATPEVITDDGGMIFGASVKGNAYNTNLVTEDEAPATWDDCLDPKWKGDFVVDSDPKTFTQLEPAWGDEKVLDYVGKLAANDPIYRRGQTQTMQLLGSGEYKMACGASLSSFLRVKEAGAPIEIVVPEPVAAQSREHFVPKGAPHPNAAVLFTIWLSTDPEAQKIIDAEGYGNPQHPGTVAFDLADGKQVSMLEGEAQLGQAKFADEITAKMGNPVAIEDGS